MVFQTAFSKISYFIVLTRKGNVQGTIISKGHVPEPRKSIRRRKELGSNIFFLEERMFRAFKCLLQGLANHFNRMYIN